MLDMLYKATKYMNAEDVLLAWEEKPRKRKRQEDIRQDRGRKMARTGERREDRRFKPPIGKFTSFTPLTASIDQVLTQIKDERALMFPGKLKETPVQGQGISTAASTMTMDMTQLTTTIWNSK